MKTYMSGLFLVLFSTLMAQNNTEITGVYTLGSAPEGSSLLWVLKNGKYAITYFGGIQVGSWKKKDKTFEFNPDVKENKFELYGRKNKNLKEQSRIFFSGFEDTDVFVGFTNEGEALKMKRVFNEDANCFGFPYIHTLDKTPGIVSFMYEHDGKASVVYTFKNPLACNDFAVLNYVRSAQSEEMSFTAVYEKNSLQILNNYGGENDSYDKNPLPEEGEDIEFLMEITNKDITSPETMYYNPCYINFEGNPEKFYEFNDEKRAYINSEYYNEGDENDDSEDAFDKMTVIFPYQAIKPIKEAKKYQLDNASIFTVTCD